MQKTVLLTLVSLFIATGCVSISELRADYVGRPIEDIVAVNGPPNSTVPMHNSTIYVWQVDGPSCYSNGYGYTGCGRGCNLAVEVDEDGRVSNVSPQGDCGLTFSE
jgi:hypothetical protein